MEKEHVIISRKYTRVHGQNFVFVTSTDKASGCFVQVPKRLTETIILQFPDATVELFLLKEGQSRFALTDALTGAKVYYGESAWDAIQEAARVVLDKGIDNFIEMQEVFLSKQGMSPAFVATTESHESADKG